MHFFSQSKNPSPSIWPLLIASMVIQSGFGTILPLLPLFVHDRGMPLTWLGFMAALYALIAFLGQLILGPLSDRLGRRPLLIVGTILSALGTALFLLPVAPVYYLLFRSLQGMGAAAFLPAANALVADYVDEDRRGRAYALMSSFFMAGFAVGPMIGGLATATGRMATPFLVGTGLDVAALVAIIVGVEGVPRQSRFHHAQSIPKEAIPWRGLVAWLFINFGWMGLGGMYDVSWSIYMRNIGSGPVLISLSWTLFAVPYLLFNFLAGRLADSPTLRPLLIYGGAVLNGIIVLLYTLSHFPWLSIALSSCEAVAMSLITPALNAGVMGVATKTTRGRIQGIFQSAGTLGAFALALLSGYLLPYGASTTFTAGTSVLFLFVALAFLWQRATGTSFLDQRPSLGPD